MRRTRALQLGSAAESAAASATGTAGHLEGESSHTRRGNHSGCKGTSLTSGHRLRASGATSGGSAGCARSAAAEVDLEELHARVGRDSASGRGESRTSKLVDDDEVDV